MHSWIIMDISTLCLLLVLAAKHAGGAATRGPATIPSRSHGHNSNIVNNQQQQQQQNFAQLQEAQVVTGADINDVQDHCPRECQWSKTRNRQRIEIFKTKACGNGLDYALVGVITNMTDRAYTVDVQTVFKVGFLPIQTRALRIMRTDNLNQDTRPLLSSCACPMLELGRRYLLSGLESIFSDPPSLQLGPGDITLKWKNRFQRNIESALVSCTTSTVAQRWRHALSSFGSHVAIEEELV